MAARRNPIGRRVARGQFKSETDRRSARTLDLLTVAIGVSPATPDISGRDDVKPNERFLRPVIVEYAVNWRRVPETQRPIG